MVVANVIVTPPPTRSLRDIPFPSRTQSLPHQQPPE